MIKAVETKSYSKYPVKGEYVLIRSNTINPQFLKFLISKVDPVEKEIHAVPETRLYDEDGNVTMTFGWYEHTESIRIKGLERVPGHSDLWRIKKRR